MPGPKLASTDARGSHEVDLRELYRGLCDYLGDRKPPWPGKGHIWTSPVKRYFFCKAVPERLLPWLEVPVEQNRRRKLDLAWANVCPETTADRLELALECEWASWRGPFEVWWCAVHEEFRKLLDTNSRVCILVTARERPCESDYLRQALNKLKEAAESASPTMPLLLVVLTPPDNPERRGCWVHGVVYSRDDKCEDLESAKCW